MVEKKEGKSFLVALILSILVGSLGVDRFYLGYVGLGILKLITGGGCGIWWIVDIILIATHKLPDASGTPLEGN
ncbi:MAG: TM2 domain-containing protein [Candidatus Omnitrophota bacterium]